jgi:hypothetical protein
VNLELLRSRVPFLGAPRGPYEALDDIFAESKSVETAVPVENRPGVFV